MGKCFFISSNQFTIKETMRKILVIACLNFDNKSGASIHLKEEVEQLSRLGNVLWLMVSNSPTKEVDDRYFLTNVVPLQKRFLRQLSWNILGIITAIRILRKFSPSVIYSRMDPGDFVGLIISKLYNIPIIYELNGLPTVDMILYRPTNRFLNSVTRFWEQACYDSAWKIVGSKGYLKYVINHFHLPSQKAIEVPLGVNVDIYNPQNQFSNPDAFVSKQEDIYITWIGSISKWQGLHTLLGAAKLISQNHKNIKVLVVGDGLLLDSLKNSTVEMGIQSVMIFTGRVNYYDVPKYINLSKCCVGTFPGNRGDKGTISALKTVSYLACGKPVITTDMDDLGEEILTRNLGMVIPPDDPQKLADAIMKIINFSSSEIDELGQRAINFINDNRRWGNTISIINNQINKLC